MGVECWGMSWHLPLGYDFLYFSNCWIAQWARASFTRFLNHTQWHTHTHTPHSLGLLWPSDRLDVATSAWQYTTLRQTYMPSPGFKPAISARERLQTYALDRAASGISRIWLLAQLKFELSFRHEFFPILGSCRCETHKKLTDSDRLLRVVRASHRCPGIWVDGSVISSWSS
jgi:hypothetical protein